MSKKIFKKIIRNWIVKLVSLIAAIILWLYLSYEQMPGKYFSVPLELKNIPKALSIAESFQNTVTVKIRGSENVLQRLTSQSFTAKIDLKNSIVGENKFPVKVEFIKPVKNVRITSTDPKEIVLKLDRHFLKKVPVSVTIINSPAEGYIKTGESFTPKTVIASGPYSVVNEIEVARTKPVDIGGVTGSIYKEVELDLPGEYVSTHNYKKISVTINIKRNYKIRHFKSVKIIIRNLRSNLTIKNSEDMHAYAKIEGPLKRLLDLERDRKFLFIDLSDVWKEDTYYKKIRYRIPWSCNLLKLDPDKMKIKIKKK